MPYRALNSAWCWTFASRLFFCVQKHHPFFKLGLEAACRAAEESIAERGVRTKINSKDTILTKEQFLKNKKDIKKNMSGVGIPQSAPISAILSNIYMIEFDKYIKRHVANKQGIYMRYSDDFIIALPYEQTTLVFYSTVRI